MLYFETNIMLNANYISIKITNIMYFELVTFLSFQNLVCPSMILKICTSFKF